MAVDEIVLNFNEDNLKILNFVIAFVIFGISLDIKIADIFRLFSSPKPVLVGLSAQFILLPAVTFAIVFFLEPLASVALGLILIASCPGGNMSNFITHLAKGNTALSVSLSAISTLLATFITPLNFAFWGSLHPETNAILKEVMIDPFKMFLIVLQILVVPSTIGITLGHYFPKTAAKCQKPLKIISLSIFICFIAVVVAINHEYFHVVFVTVSGIVVIHNFSALAVGYLAAYLSGLKERERRAICIEVGIQNTALGMVLVFNFFDGLGGMAILAAWWGVWHFFTGVGLAWYWGRNAV